MLLNIYSSELFKRGRLRSEVPRHAPITPRLGALAFIWFLCDNELWTNKK